MYRLFLIIALGPLLSILGGWLGQAVPTTDGSTQDFILDAVLRLGFPTAALVALAKEWFVTGGQYRYVVERVKAAEARNLDNEELWRGTVLPALLKNTSALEEVAKLVDDLTPIVGDLVRTEEHKESRRR